MEGPICILIGFIIGVVVCGFFAGFDKKEPDCEPECEHEFDKWDDCGIYFQYRRCQKCGLMEERHI